MYTSDRLPTVSLNGQTTSNKLEMRSYANTVILLNKMSAARQNEHQCQ